MRALLLSPRWLGIHLAAVLIAFGCGMGAYWQFSAAINPERDAVPAPEDITSPDDIDSVVGPGEYLPMDLANQGVSATGQFDPDRQLLVPGRSLDGELGYYVISALVTDGNTAVAVNRGWLEAAEGEANDVPTPPEDTVTVTGWLSPPQAEETEGLSASSLPAGHIDRVTPAILVNEWPYNLYEGYITAIDDASSLAQAPPVETPEKYDLNWRNLSYGAQWAMFGVVALIFWGVLVRRELNGDDTPTDSPGSEPVMTSV
ncbi:SURF1 family protein [Spiractinospora alimapuensis]|uniref:SURF1 family protein n=1 Tax=Spiractinospora alimapuensis TaxID=2820884 RepID=UPI001F400172|nr:SURF1 family protein [Spiractinospora alimapuensis]QVQ50320.1 SURF1 family protein [Spiractinospora alimapuensis]